VRGAEWQIVAEADAVVPGMVAAAEVGGRELVVWRRLEGGPVVMDARCPHEWSHLAADGAVDGDEIVCLAHFWRVGPDGCGTKLNVKGRRDDKAPIPTFAARERGGSIEALLPGPVEPPATGGG
jgi:phenylpropionate dioxygenase-like ring-hydroxylating dioxygenase large terminal subunit